MSAPWLRGSLLLTVTLLAGIVIGGAIVHLHLHGVASMADMGDTAHVMSRLDHELSLDAAQHEHVRAILARRQPAIDSIWDSVRPGVHAVLDSALHEIMGELRPDQRTRFMQLVEQVHPGVFKLHTPD